MIEPGVTVGPARPATAPTFDGVYAAHVDFAWRMLERLGVPTAQLEDAVQDVFIVVHRQLARFRSESSLKTWVGGIAVRVAHDYRRAASRKGEQLGLDEALHVADKHSTPFDLASASNAMRLVGRLLERLDDVHRTTFVLAELEELSAPDIAQMTEVPLNTVYSRLRAARARFNALVDAQRAGEP